MEDLEFSIVSEDGGGLDSSGDFSGSNYSNVRVGIDYGADRMKGGGDDTVITSGSSTQLIDEFIYVGVGNAYDASSAVGDTNQQKLDNTFRAIRTTPVFDVTGTYTLFDSGGSLLGTGSTFITVVPEPAGCTVVVLLSMMFAGRRRSSSRLERSEATQHLTSSRPFRLGRTHIFALNEQTGSRKGCLMENGDQTISGSVRRATIAIRF